MTILTVPDRAATPTSTPSRRVAVAPDVALDYVERGDPSGLPVILLHGYTDSRQSYQPLLATLPTGLRMIAVSHRGHGDSDKPASRYDAAELAADVGRFMDALGIPAAVIVGHSMSSQVAQHFAAHHPERTRALVLMGAFTRLAGHAEVEGLREGVAGPGDPVDEAFVRDFQQSTLARPVPSWFFERIVSESLKVPTRVWRAALDAMIEEDSAACLASIAAPTLVLWGDKDRIGSRRQQALMSMAIRDARLTIYGGVGHSPHWEAPHRAAADIATFLDAVMARTARARVSR